MVGWPPMEERRRRRMKRPRETESNEETEFGRKERERRSASSKGLEATKKKEIKNPNMTAEERSWPLDLVGTIDEGPAGVGLLFEGHVDSRRVAPVGFFFCFGFRGIN